MGRNKFPYLNFLLICFILLKCSFNPQEIQPGEKICEHCKMSIIDLKYHTEFISSKGKIYHFDSIDCLLKWNLENKEQNKESGKFWIQDFSNSKQFILANNALFLKSEKLKSPMGVSLAGFQSKEDLEKLKETIGGEIYDFSEVKELIEKSK